jgi:hypothetical protein
MGDKAAWAPRIAQGMDTLYTHALKGFMGNGGYMPPKGGRIDLSDQSVVNAVNYIVVGSHQVATEQAAQESDARGHSSPELERSDDESVAISAQPSPPTMFRLTVEPTPPDARVRILNIRTLYEPGIQLEPGRYIIEVSRDGYDTVSGPIQLARDTTAIVSLCRMITKTDRRTEEYQTFCPQERPPRRETLSSTAGRGSSGRPLSFESRREAREYLESSNEDELIHECEMRDGEPDGQVRHQRLDCEVEPGNYTYTAYNCELTSTLSCRVPQSVEVECTQQRTVEVPTQIRDPQCPASSLSISNTG